MAWKLYLWENQHYEHVSKVSKHGANLNYEPDGVTFVTSFLFTFSLVGVLQVRLVVVG